MHLLGFGISERLYHASIVSRYDTIVNIPNLQQIRESLGVKCTSHFESEIPRLRPRKPQALLGMTIDDGAAGSCWGLRRSWSERTQTALAMAMTLRTKPPEKREAWFLQETVHPVGREAEEESVEVLEFVAQKQDAHKQQEDAARDFHFAEMRAEFLQEPRCTAQPEGDQ